VSDPPPRVDPFLHRNALTRAFSLGLPRGFTVAADGSRVAFLRSAGPTDPVQSLWVLDVASGNERLVADAAELLTRAPDGAGNGAISDTERVRRERVGEQAAGIVAYAGDATLRRATFALDGRLFLGDLVDGSARELAAAGPPDDPRLDPSGERLAYVTDGALVVRELVGGGRELAADPDPLVTWGLAEHVAAEEMHRFRGHWWSPGGDALAACRVDQRPVRLWYLGDPSDPAAPPTRVRYPVAGSDNAIVTLHVFDLEGGRLEIDWDIEAFPYLARVDWSKGTPLTMLVQSRDQRVARIVEADPATGDTSVALEDTDPDWVALVAGSPARLDDGTLVSTSDADDTNRLRVGDRLVTPPGLQVREILHTGDVVLFAASEDPTETHVWRWHPDDGLERVSQRPGVHAARSGGGTIVLTSASLDEPLPSTVVRASGGDRGVGARGEVPEVRPEPTMFTVGDRQIRCALLTPSGRAPVEALPVLLDPYGGPGFARVERRQSAFRMSQWFADQGFVVLVADGRGTPGRGSAWERAVRGDLASMALEDQVDALHGAAERFGFLDLSRVGMRGWSFGGYLTALALLRRPDVVHAGVVGAPVSDWTLYDTHYTERYLGDPRERPDVYERSSLLRSASGLRGDMLLVHGLADDNVVAAHTLRLSAALLDAGRAHRLMLLPGSGHRTGARALRELLPSLEVDFLRETLGA
jgi:dipeptidyl-peptidase 4